MNNITLRLYIAGETSRSRQAIANLQHICEAEMGADCKIEVVDVLDNPELAEKEKILATPTLIKILPPPLRRIIGDLSQTEKVLVGLDISTGNSTNSEAE